MSNSKKEKRPFYTKFLNVENVYNIEKQRVRSYVVMRDNLFIPFGLIIGFLATMVGYNFDHIVARSTFFIELVFLALTLIIFLKQFLVFHKYKLFKKERYFWIIYPLNYVLIFGECISAYFNTTFEIYENGGYGARVFALYYLVIFLPLTILYWIFINIAIDRGFNKIEKEERNRKIHLHNMEAFNEIIDNMNTSTNQNDDLVDGDDVNDIDKEE